MTCWRGGTFRQQSTLHTGATSTSPLRDLTGYSATFRLEDTDGVELFTLTQSASDAGQILLGGALGTVTVLIPAALTQEFDWDAGLYELRITAPGGGDTDPLLWGAFAVRGA